MIRYSRLIKVLLLSTILGILGTSNFKAAALSSRFNNVQDLIDSIPATEQNIQENDYVNRAKLVFSNRTKYDLVIRSQEKLYSLKSNTEINIGIIEGRPICILCAKDQPSNNLELAVSVETHDSQILEKSIIVDRLDRIRTLKLTIMEYNGQLFMDVNEI